MALARCLTRLLPCLLLAAGCKGGPTHRTKPLAPDGGARPAPDATAQGRADGGPPKPPRGTGASRVRLPRWLSIESIIPPPPRPPSTTSLAPATTAMLHGATPGVMEVGDGIRIETRCGDYWCVDGLSIDGRVIAEPRPAPEEIAWLNEKDEDGYSGGSELQRAIRVAWHDESVVSVYLMEASYGSGGNHFNNEMKCRTYDRKTGRPLRLRDVLDARTLRLLPRIRRFVAQDAMVGVGEGFGPGGFEITNQGFRLEGPSQVVLCAEAPFQLGGNIVELRPEQAVKNLYLMQ